MMRLFDYAARLPAPNPLTRCSRCGRAWGTLPCPADWHDDDSHPDILLMVPMMNGDVICARCMYQAALGDTDYARLVPWHKAQWSYLYEIGRAPR